MGLDTTHGCWHGSYMAFMRWRKEIARAAGLPPLELMEDYFLADEPLSDPFLSFPPYYEGASLKRLKESLPIRWDCLKPSPLHALLRHSDAEGTIEVRDCEPMADALEALVPLLTGDIREWTQIFVDGLRLAVEKNEAVEFH